MNRAEPHWIAWALLALFLVGVALIVKGVWL